MLIVRVLKYKCLDVEIKFPDGELNFDKYLGKGQQPGEELLPADAPAAAAGKPQLQCYHFHTMLILYYRASIRPSSRRAAYANGLP